MIKETCESLSLEEVLCNEELKRRPSRRPDYERETQALAMLVQALADSPQTILKTLTDTILKVLHAHSSGISLLTEDGNEFYWPAISGAWEPHIGGGTPRSFGPCGDVLDCNGPLLFKQPERRYDYLLKANSPVREALLVPFYFQGKTVGTLWAIAHNDERQFDAEDLRLLQSLGRFTSAAYQTVEARRNLEKANAALHESEQQTKRARDYAHATLRTSPVPLLVLEKDFRVASANKAFYETFQVNSDETEGRLIYDLGNGQWNIPKLRELFESLLPRQTVIEGFEVAHQFESIGYRTMLINARRMANEPDVPERIVCVVEDITGRKRAEEALRASEQRYRELFESMKEGYCIIEMIFNSERTGAVDYRFLEVNSAFEAESGMRNVVGRCMLEFVPSIEEHWLANYGKVAITGEPVRFANEYKTLNRWFEVYAYRVGAPGSGRIAVLFTDITERKRLEETWRDSAAQLEAATSAGAVGIWNWDLNPNLLTANPALLRIFGLNDANGGLSPEAFIAAIVPEDQTPVREAIARALVPESNGIYEAEYRVRTPEGKIRWVFARGQVEYDAAHKPSRLPGALTDITERKFSGEQIQRGAELLKVLIDRSPTGFYIVDADFCISHINADSQGRAFRNVNPAVGRRLDDAMRVLWPEPLATEIIGIFRHTLDTGEPYKSPGLISERADLDTVETYEWQLERITMTDKQSASS